MSTRRGGDGASQAAEATPPKIEFPCENYPIKIVGDAAPDYEAQILAMVEIHAPGFDRRAVTVRDSSNGRYRAITVRITATGEPQLKAIFEELKRHPAVRMVL